MLNRIQSFLLAPRIDLNFIHLPSCGTIVAIIENHGKKTTTVCHVGTGNILVNVSVQKFDRFCDSRSSNRTPKKINCITIVNPKK